MAEEIKKKRDLNFMTIFGQYTGGSCIDFEWEDKRQEEIKSTGKTNKHPYFPLEMTDEN